MGEQDADGNGRYIIMKLRDELLQKLERGLKLVQALNNGKYML
ncbi:MAG: hypothetical protein ACUVUF_07910 [Candidatus Bathycorpusculaceae bacterium]